VRIDCWRLAFVFLPLTVACGSVQPTASTSAEDGGVESSGPVAPTEDNAAESSVAEGGGGGGTAQMESPAGAGGTATGGAMATGGVANAGSAGVGQAGEAGEMAMPPAGEPLPLALDGTPERHRYVRLTHEQWENSVQDNLRWVGATGLLDGLFPDVVFSRYSNNEDHLAVRPALVVDYAEAAETLARQVATDPTLLVAVYPGNDTLGFISEVGRRFYRRPLTSDELAKLEAIFATGAGLPSASDEFTGGASLVLEVLLQAPHFLYRIEAGETGQRLSGYELATKLAYVLTNSTPSDALLDQAASGALDADEGVRAAAEGLLSTARAKATLRRFHGETFGFDAFSRILKEAGLGYADGTNADLLEASYLFFDRIFEDSLGLRDVFLSDVGFVSDEMAALYGSDGPEGDGFLEVRLGTERPGFFAQLPFLILQSTNLTPHSIGRGRVINHDVLCAEVPAESETMSPPGSVGATNRETVTLATAGEGCVGCHQYLNPLGFAFENFDGLGRLRDEDNGFPVDTTGRYPFVEGSLSFDGAPQLMQLLAESQQAHTCYASHLAEFGLAHELSADEKPLLDAMSAASLEDAAPLQDLLLELVTSPTFQTRRGTP
jgi:hypothetical protein